MSETRTPPPPLGPGDGADAWAEPPPTLPDPPPGDLRPASWLAVARSEILVIGPAGAAGGLLDCLSELPCGTSGPELRLVLPADVGEDALDRARRLAVPGRGQLRVVPELPTVLVVLDRRVGLVAEECGGRPTGRLVVRAPVAVKALVALFEYTWASAQEPVASDRVLFTGLRGEILRMLASGLTNDAVARQLSISSRTVQRHVAQAMELTGVRSRLELGIRLGAPRVPS
ncbi:helix-turn-helix transcriptional regulator [Kitasatospora sp. NPDC004240]